jgi:hypothetical protein
MDETTGLRADKTIVLTGYRSKKHYLDNLRLVEYYDSEKDVLLIFLSNSFEATALEIACLYKIRWQIEVFFKWIKQNLTIKHFRGNSGNAVKIHVWMAICTYLTPAYAKHSPRSKLSIYGMMRIPGISAFDKTSVKGLLTELHVNQNVKKQLELFSINFLTHH